VARTAAVSELTASPDFTVACAEDEAELRALLRKAVIPGPVRVALTREPDYLAGETLGGNEDTTLVARQDGRMVGMGRCSINTMYRNGVPTRVAYLGELRVEPDAPRSPALLREGYEILASHAGHADGFFTSIASDNLRARRVLERGARFGLPDYSAICDLVTLVMPVGRGTAERVPSPADVVALAEFLDRKSRQCNLSLTWNASRWAALARHGASPESFVVIREGGDVTGAAGIWDQRAFRQIVVDGYDRSVSLARPLFNGVQSLRGMGRLPAPGTVLAQGMLLGAFVQDPDDWTTLWPALARRARTMGLSWLTIARQADDPELAVLRRISGVREYHTTLYAVDWRAGPHWADAWETRPFRPEVSLL
jgi:hypothetical protein